MYIYRYMNINLNICTLTCIYACIYIYIYINVNLYICILTYIYMYIYENIHILNSQPHRRFVQPFK